MYKPYSKLSEKELAKIYPRPTSKNYFLEDVTDYKVKLDISGITGEPLIDVTFENLINQLDKIEGIGTYTILIRKDYRIEILFVKTLPYHINMRISNIMKAVFGIDTSSVVYPKKVKRRKHHV